MGALHMWSTAGSKLDLFSATSELAPNRNIESKWPMAMHGAYHSRVPITIAQNEPLDRSSDHSILFVRIQDATLQPRKKRSEQARSLHSVLGSSLSLTLPHSYSFPLLPLKVPCMHGIKTYKEGPSTDIAASSYIRRGTKVA